MRIGRQRYGSCRLRHCWLGRGSDRGSRRNCRLQNGGYDRGLERRGVAPRAPNGGSCLLGLGTVQLNWRGNRYFRRCKAKGKVALWNGWAGGHLLLSSTSCQTRYAHGNRDQKIRTHDPSRIPQFVDGAKIGRFGCDHKHFGSLFCGTIRPATFPRFCQGAQRWWPPSTGKSGSTLLRS